MPAEAMPGSELFPPLQAPLQKEFPGMTGALYCGDSQELSDIASSY